MIISIAWKVSKYGVISGPYFPVFGLNTGKYRPEITPYLDTFHVEYLFAWLVFSNGTWLWDKKRGKLIFDQSQTRFSAVVAALKLFVVWSKEKYDPH